MEGNSSRECEICKGKCWKECKGEKIKNIEAAKVMEGCTFIKGALEINIKHHYTSVVRNQLEEYLGAIEVITGYLRVTRSSIGDLKFLRDLSMIRGEGIGNEKYSLFITDNQNLQELWDWDLKTNLSLLNGRMTFHYNPKLCLHHIYKLIKVMDYEVKDSLYEVGKESNGDKFPCNAIDIKVHVTRKTFETIDIHVPFIGRQINYTGPILRYVLYYAKDPFRNITKFDDLDQCSEDGWKTEDIAVDTLDLNTVNFGFNVSMVNLESATQYVFYVNTYTLNKIGAKSNMKYETTLPSTPSELKKLEAYSQFSSEIQIYWGPPKHVNGILEKFVVSWVEHGEHGALKEFRDYCKHPMDLTNIKGNEMAFESSHQNANSRVDLLHSKPLEGSNTKNLSYNNCFCDNTEDLYTKEEFEGLCKNFKNYNFPIGSLENGRFSSCESYFYSCIFQRPFVDVMFQEKSSSNMDYRPLSVWQNEIALDDTDESSLKTKNKQYDSHTQHRFQMHLKNFGPDDTNVTLTDLKHFTTYIIKMKACRKHHREEGVTSEDTTCSKPETLIVRTLKDQFADNISDISYKIVDERTASLTWNVPENPNGFIVAFDIELHVEDVEKTKIMKDCLSYNEDDAKTIVYPVKNLALGENRLRVRAVSLAGKGPFTPFLLITISESLFSPIEVVVITVLSLSLVSIIVICACYLQKMKNKTILTLVAEVNPSYHYIPDSYEMNRESIELVQEIGMGSFGKVYKGIVKPGDTACAVKTVFEGCSEEREQEFLREASIMKSMTLAHFIVKLLGVVSSSHPPLVLMELMEFGDLKNYLRSQREISPLSNAVKIKMALEIADAMAFMEAYKFVHRDLAARNCMVNSDLTVKVGDFGMARDIYETDYYRQSSKGFLPIRWMAPESLRDGEFASPSDVWSYGVLLWEILTMAEQPYQGLSNEQVLNGVIDGTLQLEIPKESHFALRSVLNSCWRTKPEKRHSFMHIVHSLEYYHEDEFKGVAYFYTEEAIQRRKDLWEYVVMESVRQPLI